MPEGAELANFARRMGAETICVSGLLRWQEREADAYRRSAEALNVWGRQLQSEGLALVYHSHDFQFASVRERLSEDMAVSRSFLKERFGL